MNACAGLLLRAPGPVYLVCKNVERDTWECPAGHLEEGETTLDAALREAKEEIGFAHEGAVWQVKQGRTPDGSPFTLFAQGVPGKFEPKLLEEFSEWQWVSSSDAPANTNPDLLASMKLLDGNETEISERIKDGLLDSPQRFENVWLFDLRITGTGYSYRPSLDEYVHRSPDVSLSDGFLKRCQGLPVVLEHPSKSMTLDAESFRKQIAGMITLPYIKNDEVWGIAKIFDPESARRMMTTHRSTSPAVVFSDAGSTESAKLPDGSMLLKEGSPSYVDHLAICEEGVWDKGEEPSGIPTPTGENTVENENESQAPAWADALVKRVDEACSRLDAIEGRKDESGFDKLEGKLEKEGESKHEAEAVAGKVAAEKGENGRKDSEEEVADSRKDSAAEKDGEKEEKFEKEAVKEGEKEHKAEERADSASVVSLKAKLAAMERDMANLTRPLSIDDRDLLAKAQARADSLSQMFGERAPAPLHGERPLAYKQRLANQFKRYSDRMKTVRLDSLDATMFDIAEEQIYADATKAAMNPSTTTEGRLIPIKTFEMGREVTRYTGDPNVWLNPFKARGMTVRIADSATRRGVN